MELIKSVLFIFAAGSSAGWLLEVFYRHFFPSIGQTKRWVNPGFLAGPCNPLYGTGLSAIYLMSFIRFPGLDPDGFWTKFWVILIMTVVMTLVEFVTGWIFILRLNIRLWDYSDNSFNYRGIVCPLYSFFWGLIAGGYYLLLHKYMVKFLPIVINFHTFYILIIAYYSIFVIDLLYSFKILRLIRNLAREFNIIVLFNAFRDKLSDFRAERKEESRFFRPMELKTATLREAFVRYKDAISFSKMRARLSNLKNRNSPDKGAV